MPLLQFKELVKPKFGTGKLSLSNDWLLKVGQNLSMIACQNKEQERFKKYREIEQIILDVKRLYKSSTNSNTDDFTNHLNELVYKVIENNDMEVILKLSSIFSFEDFRFMVELLEKFMINEKFRDYMFKNRKIRCILFRPSNLKEQTCFVAILKVLLRHDASWCIEIFKDSNIYKLLEIAKIEKLDSAADIYKIIERIFNKNSVITKHYLKKHDRQIFQAFFSIINCDGLYTHLWSIRMLYSILINNDYIDVTKIFLKEVQNLIMVMKLFKNNTPSSAMITFNILKLFICLNDLTLEQQTIIGRNGCTFKKLIRKIIKHSEDRRVIREFVYLDKVLSLYMKEYGEFKKTV